MLSSQLYGVKAHMDENFYSVIRFKADGMKGIKNRYHRTIDRRNDMAVRWNDSNALPKNLLGKCGIVYLL